MQFIYVEEELREKMISLGYKEVMSCNTNKRKYYIYYNNIDKYSSFSSLEKRKMLFTNKLIFV